MIIIEENTLIHVDSSSDVIEHYGVKGMKWGVRRRAERRVKSYDKKVRKAMGGRSTRDVDRDIGRMRSIGYTSQSDQIRMLTNEKNRLARKQAGIESSLKSTKKYAKIDKLRSGVEAHKTNKSIYKEKKYYNKTYGTIPSYLNRASTSALAGASGAFTLGTSLYGTKYQKPLYKTAAGFAGVAAVTKGASMAGAYINNRQDRSVYKKEKKRINQNLSKHL